MRDDSGNGWHSIFDEIRAALLRGSNAPGAKPGNHHPDAIQAPGDVVINGDGHTIFVIGSLHLTS
jgi:hypothetical protein